MLPHLGKNWDLLYILIIYTYYIYLLYILICIKRTSQIHLRKDVFFKTSQIHHKKDVFYVTSLSPKHNSKKECLFCKVSNTSQKYILKIFVTIQKYPTIMVSC